MDLIFKTDRRIRPGIRGLGRGQSFTSSAQFLDIDIVAGRGVSKGDAVAEIDAWIGALDYC